eukprot:3494240-Rhodomonas_salina.1
MASHPPPAPQTAAQHAPCASPRTAPPHTQHEDHTHDGKQHLRSGSRGEVRAGRQAGPGLGMLLGEALAVGLAQLPARQQSSELSGMQERTVFPQRQLLCTQRQRETERDRERETERERQRQRDRERARERYRDMAETNRETERQADRHWPSSCLRYTALPSRPQAHTRR